MNIIVSEQNRITAYANNPLSDRISSKYSDEEKSSKDLIKRTGEKFVAENTPAYSVAITASGMAALKSISLQQKSKNEDTLGDFDINSSINNNGLKGEVFESDDYDNINSIDNIDNNDDLTDNNETEDKVQSYDKSEIEEGYKKAGIAFNEAINNSAAQDDILTEKDDRDNINNYEDIQSQFSREAIAAYQFQMAYQINAAMLQ